MRHQQPLARLLAPRVLHHADVMPGDVGHDGVLVIAGLDLRQEALRHALQLGLGELHGLLRLGHIGLEIGRQAGQLLAHALDLIALGLGQLQSRPAEIAHRFLQQLGILPCELRLRIGVSLDRLIDVLAVIQAHLPFLQAA